MASEKEYLESLGLEIAKRKYYNAAKVEGVIGDFSRRIAALEEENSSLRARAEALACGRMEIGDAILSAKTISQQIIAEAREQADAILAEARAEAERLTNETRENARTAADACEAREQRTVRAVQDCYLQLREQCLDAVRMLDGEWQRFLCSFGEDVPDETALPNDLSDKLGVIAQSLREIDTDEKQEM